MSHLQTYYHIKVNFQKVDQHTGGKWLIHGTKRHNDYDDNNSESLCSLVYAMPGTKTVTSPCPTMTEMHGHVLNTPGLA